MRATNVQECHSTLCPSSTDTARVFHSRHPGCFSISTPKPSAGLTWAFSLTESYLFTVQTEKSTRPHIKPSKPKKHHGAEGGNSKKWKITKVGPWHNQDTIPFTSPFLPMLPTHAIYPEALTTSSHLWDGSLDFHILPFNLSPLPPKCLSSHFIKHPEFTLR